MKKDFSTYFMNKMQFENHELNMYQTIDSNRAISIQHCNSLFCTLFLRQTKKHLNLSIPRFKRTNGSAKRTQKKFLISSKKQLHQYRFDSLQSIQLDFDFLIYFFFFWFGVIPFQKKTMN